MTRRAAPLQTPTDLGPNATKDISAALTALLADCRDYHLLLDEQADQIFAMTDAIAERARKLGGTTLRSIGHVARLQRIPDNDAEFVTPEDMLAELASDNRQLIGILRSVHDTVEEHNDVATASLLEVWIDEAERRVWFLYESTRKS